MHVGVLLPLQGYYYCRRTLLAYIRQLRNTQRSRTLRGIFHLQMWWSSDCVRPCPPRTVIGRSRLPDRWQPCQPLRYWSATDARLKWTWGVQWQVSRRSFQAEGGERERERERVEMWYLPWLQETLAWMSDRLRTVPHTFRTSHRATVSSQRWISLCCFTWRWNWLMSWYSIKGWILRE